MIFTGAIDEFFGFKYGKLSYRSLRFEHLTIRQPFYQVCRQIDNPNEHFFTRIVECKHATKQKINITSVMKEYLKEFIEGKERYYSVLDKQTILLADK